jgi:5-methylcytosine-specific restriction endonuclease McrA
VNRRARNKIIEDLLTPIYKRKDPNRAFSKEQKQLLWGQKRDLRCPGPDCNVILDWRDVHVDHVMPHSKGGATTIENGRLLCSKCNLAKGAKLPKMQGQ